MQSMTHAAHKRRHLSRHERQRQARAEAACWAQAEGAMSSRRAETDHPAREARVRPGAPVGGRPTRDADTSCPICHAAGPDSSRRRTGFPQGRSIVGSVGAAEGVNRPGIGRRRQPEAVNHRLRC